MIDGSTVLTMDISVFLIDISMKGCHTIFSYLLLSNTYMLYYSQLFVFEFVLLGAVCPYEFFGGFIL